MKRFQKLTALLVLLAFSLVLFIGCASKSESTVPAADSGKATGGYSGAPAPEKAPVVNKDAATVPNQSGLGYTTTLDRKVIKTAQIAMESSSYDDDKAAILALVERVGGYVQYASEYGNKPEDYKDKGRTAQYTFRIPQESFANFLSELDKIGTQLQRTLGGEDITSQYTDVETRLKTLRTKLDRLEALLLKAEKMEDIISLENAISDTTMQIEQYTATLRNWDNLAAEASVGVTLTEVVKVDAFKGVKDETFGDKLSNAFNSAIAGIIEAAKWLVLTIISLLPALIVLGVITAAIVVPISISQKRKRKQMIAKQNENRGDRNQ